VRIAGVIASSSYPPDQAFTYEPNKTIDGKISTAWVEGDPGSGLGSWIELDLGADHDIAKIRVWGGMWYSSEYWSRANRPKQIELKFSDGSTETMALSDEMTVQEMVFASPKKSSSVRFKVKGAHSGTTWQDTGISEIQIFDTAADRVVGARGHSASTTLPADADGNYAATNVADGIVDTMWCEGTEDGDGTAEWLHFDFGASTRVSKLQLINGMGTGIKYWIKANRIVRATIEWSDASTQSVAVKNSALVQTLDVGPKQTSSARITFDEVKRGTEYNDLCVSEAAFLE